MEFDIPNDRCTRIRIKSSGQVIDAIPAVARAMLNGGTAELVKSSGGAAPETARIAPPERAVALVDEIQASEASLEVVSPSAAEQPSAGVSNA